MSRHKGISRLPKPLAPDLTPHDGAGEPEGLPEHVIVQFRMGTRVRTTLAKLAVYQRDPWTWGARAEPMDIVGHRSDPAGE